MPTLLTERSSRLLKILLVAAILTYPAWPLLNMFSPGKVEAAVAKYTELEEQLDDGDADYNGYHGSMISDGVGGALYFYNIGEDEDMYIQRVDETGAKLWGVDGTNLTGTANYVSEENMVSDGAGGAFTWMREDFGGIEYRVQKINSSGVVQWGADGVDTLATSAGSEVGLIPDGSGGLYVFWSTNVTNPGHLRGQHFNSAGVAQWTAGGVAVATGDTNDRIRLYGAVPGADAGDSLLFYGFNDDSTSTDYFYVQEVNASGTNEFGGFGTEVFSTTNEVFFLSYSRRFISDGAGGIVIMWTDESTPELLAQRVASGTGATAWTSGGLIIEDSGDNVYPSEIVADGSGNFYFAWDTEYLGDHDEGRVTKINSGGSVVWENEYNNNDDYYYVLDIIDDGNGGLYVVVNEDGTFYYVRIYHIDSAGDDLWDDGVDNYFNIMTTYSDNFDYVSAVEGADNDLIYMVEDFENDTIVHIGNMKDGYQISNLPGGFDIRNLNDESYIQGGTGGNGTETVRIVKTGFPSYVVAEIDVDFTGDLDWTGFNADTDIGTGKAFVDGLTTSPGTGATHTLYIPMLPGQDAVIICPTATSLVEVEEACAGAIEKTEADLDTEIVNINGQDYWAVSGLSGTGGIGVDQDTGIQFVITPNFAATSATQEVSAAFTTSSEYGIGDQIAIDFDTGGDFVLDNCAAATVDADGDTTDDGAGVAITNGGPNNDRFLYTFTDPTTDASTTGIDLCIEVNTPATAGNYQVDLYDTLGNFASAIFYVGNENQVQITAEVDTVFTLVIRNSADTADQANVNGLPVGPNLCDLGNLSDAGVQTCSYRLKVTSNAGSGYTVNIATDGSLRNSSDTEFIDNVTEDTTVGSGTEGYGIAFAGGECTGIAAPATEAGDFADDDTPTATAVTTGIDTTLYSCSSANNPSGTDLTNTALVTHRAEADSGTPAGTYVQLVTYTVSGSF